MFKKNMFKDGMIIMEGTKYLSILRGNIDYSNSIDMVNVIGKYKSFNPMAKPNKFYNIPLALVGKEKELLWDEEPTGIYANVIHQSTDGQKNFAYVNSKMVEQVNSLWQENLKLKNENIMLKRANLMLSNKPLMQEEQLRDFKTVGKARALSYYGTDTDTARQQFIKGKQLPPEFID